VQKFRLVPYPASDLPKIQITGEIERTGNRLSIRYVVTGEIDSVLLPAVSNSAARQDDLWKATCFEFFIAIKDHPRYWEFNMSPSGNWNVYAMEAYRQVNMREELALTQLPFEFKKTNAEISLDISVDLNPILEPAQVLQIGVTTIIQTNDSSESYWALAHPGPHADFHLRESFTLVVE
jgi:hypothetical protein